MKNIVITQRVEFIKERKETVDTLDHKIIDFVIKCGFSPILLPNNFYNHTKTYLKNYNFLTRWINQQKINGIILSGGNDLGESKKRDNVEKIIIKFAKNNKIPLLGICRGMQILSKINGSNLKEVKNHIGRKHKISGIINQKVNSFHKFSITKCPKDFYITSKSLDGEIESIKHIYLPWEGWMWHPERNKIYKKHDIDRIKKLFKY